MGKEEEKTVNVYSHILNGYWTAAHVQFQSRSEFISVEETYKQHSSDHG